MLKRALAFCTLVSLQPYPLRVETPPVLAQPGSLPTEQVIVTAPDSTSDSIVRGFIKSYMGREGVAEAVKPVG
jgi:hypothetical protein